MATICNRCGAEPAEHSATCPGCGAATPFENLEEVDFPVQIPPPEQEVRTEPAGSTTAPPLFATETDLKGIGGWLIPTVIALAIGPISTLRAIYLDLHVLSGSGFQAGLAARPGLAVLILFEAMTNAILLFALIGLNVLFYGTRKSFPRWMITYLIAALCLSLIDHLVSLHFHPEARWTGVFQRLVAALIWVPYYLQSRRVRQTFVD
jgi:hypothetical protein